MGKETLRSIGEATTELFGVDGVSPFGGVGKMNTSDVSSCRCCGKDLTDWRSQATGVGPVCSKYLGIPYVKKEEDVVVYKKLLKLKIDKIGDLTFWLAKSQIKEGKTELEESIK